MPQPSPVPGVNFSFIASNGIRMRVATAGAAGPLVVMAHGWPESWYSWRHQILALAAAGYRVVAPDMRGYGETDAPQDIDAYNIRELAADMVGIVDAFGEKQAILMGHDWGAIVAWNTVLLHPDRFSALIALSVPFSGRPSMSPLEFWKKRFGDRFFYILYHQQPGVAEKEYDADPYGILSRLYQSPDAPREEPEITDRSHHEGGWIKRLGKPKSLPTWLNKEDMDYFVAQFKKAGFQGGVNYYRNFQRNWDMTPELTGASINIPVLFIAGEGDSVLAGARQEQLEAGISKVAKDLRGVIVFPDAGHWIQQELPEATNAAVLTFLSSIK